MSPSIETVSLSKRYNSFYALSKLNLRIEGSGKCVGFLGPNGAGKTTTLKLFTALIFPTEGQALINGVDVREDKKGALASCGVLIETPEIYPALTAREALRMIAETRGVPRGERNGRIDDVLALVKNGAPPYALGSGNATFGTPSGSLGSTGNMTLGSPPFTPVDSAGTMGTPSGSQTYQGLSDTFLLTYGLLPTVTFNHNPAAGGSITFNGTSYTNGQSGNYTYGNATAQATPPAGYAFSSWSSTGGISVASSSANPTTVTVSGPGSLQANFTPIGGAPLAPSSALLAILIATTLPILLRRKRR